MQREGTSGSSGLLDGAILSSLRDHIAVIDREGRLLTVNEAWVRFAGEHGTTVEGRVLAVSNYLEVCRRAAAEGEPMAAAALEGIEAVLSGSVDRFSLEYDCPSAVGKRWSEVTVLPLLRPEGGALVSHADITERKEIEEQLRTSEKLLKRAREVARLGSWRFDMASGQISWSEEVCEMFGISEDEAVTYERFLGFVHPDDRDFVDRKWKAALLGEPYDIEHRIVVAGQEKWVRERAELDRSGENGSLRWMGIVQEVTQRKEKEGEIARLQEELRRAARSAMMGELVAALAHELNQPLTGILANAQAALGFLAQEPNGPREIGSILEDIVEDGRRAGGIIRRVRSLFSKEEFRLEPLDINDAIQDLLPLLRSHALLEEVSFYGELAPEKLTVCADRIQLQQVLLNLVFNAFEAMKHSKTRQLRLRTGRSEAGAVTVSIEDSGDGIPEGKAEEIFRPFYTTKPHGMGMGLPICRSIVSAHGGRIWFENRPQGGVSFSFRLPGAPARSRLAPASCT